MSPEELESSVERLTTVDFLLLWSESAWRSDAVRDDFKMFNFGSRAGVTDSFASPKVYM